MSVKQRAACFIGIILLISLGLEIYILQDIVKASPAANQKVEETFLRLTDLFAPMGFQADANIKNGVITFTRERSQQRSASRVFATVDYEGNYNNVRGDISFSVKESADSIYREADSVAAFFGGSLAGDRDKILEVIRIIQSDEPKVTFGNGQGVGWSLSSASDRNQERCIIFGFDKIYKSE